MKPPKTPPEKPVKKSRDKKGALRSVGNDATSYHGNQTSRVISMPKWAPKE